MSFIDEQRLILQNLQAKRRQLTTELQVVDLQVETLEYKLADFAEYVERIAKLRADGESDETTHSFEKLVDDLSERRAGEFKEQIISHLYGKFEHNVDALSYMGYKLERELIPILQKFSNVPAKVWSSVIMTDKEVFDLVPEYQRQDFAFLTALLEHGPFVYNHFFEQARRDPDICLAFLKSCTETEVSLSEFGPENFKDLIPLLEDRVFARQAVVNWPYVSYLLPKDLAEDAEFAYELFKANPDSAKPHYLSIDNSYEDIDHDKARTELKAKSELQALKRGAPQGEQVTKAKFKV